MSPISRAASAVASISSRRGPLEYNIGRILNSRAQRTRTSATDVRELVSSAIERTSRIRFRVNSATDATGPREAIETPGTIR